MKKPAIALIGPGKVGQAMARLLTNCGYTLAAIGGRTQSRAGQAAQHLNPPPPVYPIAEASGLADLVLITVKDDAIEDVVKQCVFRKDAIVIHMSGTHSSHVLDAAKKQFNCQTASFHALQTFATIEQAVKVLPGCSCFIEGDEQACLVAEQMADDLSMTPIRFASSGKPLYHAAAVMACNYLTALTDAVFRTADAAGIRRQDLQKAFMPLISSTLENIYTTGTLSALTGPIERGDLNTVSTHLGALQTLPDVQDIYRALGRYTAQLAQRKQSITPDTTDQIQELLTSNNLKRLPVIGVMGSGSSIDKPRAKHLGTWLAHQPVHLLTGGGQGNMEAVCRAFATVPNRRGNIIGILPGQAHKDHYTAPPGYPNPWIEIPIRTHLPHSGEKGDDPLSRNHINVLTSDIIIALPGSHGTLSEIQLALRYERPVVAYISQRNDIPNLPDTIPLMNRPEELENFMREKLLQL